VGPAFTPVGIARIPGLILAADSDSRTVWSTTRPPDYQCPADVSCTVPPSAPLIVAPFAGGGTEALDNIPAVDASFGYKQVEAGVFDMHGSLGEISTTTLNVSSKVFITDIANNRIRMVDGGTN